MGGTSGYLREVYQSEAPREKEGGPMTRFGVCEESSGVESHDIDYRDISTFSCR